MTKKAIKNLIKKYQYGHPSIKERNAVDKWYNHIAQRSLAEPIESDPLVAKQEIWMRLQKELLIPDAKVRTMSAKYSIAIAAAIALVIFGAGLYLYTLKPEIQNERRLVLQKIVPGGNRATLKLVNGEVIQLSGDKSGVIVGAELKYNDNTTIVPGGSGELINMESAPLIASTPRGGMYNFVLPDGSEVTLNAATVFRFPSTFSGKARREVELVSGEAYFEIAKDKKHPFIVKSRQQEVEVLGTHFNLNSYDDEASVKTTLEEGRVKVISRGQIDAVYLKPGQQAANHNNTITVKQIDLSSELAWKNGMFIFEGQDFRSVMRAIGRWYDVDIAFEYDPRDLHLGVQVPRSVSLKDLLKSIQNTGDVKFKIEGRRVSVIR